MVLECGCPVRCLRLAERRMKYCECVGDVEGGEGKEEDHGKGRQRSQRNVCISIVVAHFSARFPELPVCSIVGVVIATAVIATGREGGRQRGRKGERERGREGEREEGRGGEREKGRKGEREEGRAGEREEGRKGGREGGREEGREGEREGGGRKGEREEGREGGRQ